MKWSEYVIVLAQVTGGTVGPPVEPKCPERHLRRPDIPPSVPNVTRAREAKKCVLLSLSPILSLSPRARVNAIPDGRRTGQRAAGVRRMVSPAYWHPSTTAWFCEHEPAPIGLSQPTNAFRKEGNTA
jgi:hypothetical protein